MDQIALGSTHIIDAAKFHHYFEVTHCMDLRIHSSNMLLGQTEILWTFLLIG